MISKARLVNLSNPDTNITHLKTTNPKLYNAIKNIGDANKQLINEVFPVPPQIGYIERFDIPVTSTPNNDILFYRYHVVLPSDPTGYWNYTQINLTACYITCKSLGSTVPTSVDIKVSQQNGTGTYISLFKSGMNPILPPHVRSTHNIQFAVATLFQDDLIRVDVLAVDSTISGMELVLVGNYSMKEVIIP